MKDALAAGGERSATGRTHHHDVVEMILAIACKFQVATPFRLLHPNFLFRSCRISFLLVDFCFIAWGKQSRGAAIAKMETPLTLVQSLIPLILLLLCLALYIVRHYVSPGTSWFIQFLVTVAFTFGFFGLALMPIDLSLTTSIDSR